MNYKSLLRIALFSLFATLTAVMVYSFILKVSSPALDTKSSSFLMYIIAGMILLIVMILVGGNSYIGYLKEKIRSSCHTSTQLEQVGEIMIIWIDQSGHVIRANENVTRRINLKIKAKPVHIRSLFMEEDRGKLDSIIYSLGGDEFELTLQNGDDPIIGVWRYSKTDEVEPLIELVGIDITERVVTERTLRSNHEELSALYEELAASEEELWSKYDELTKSELDLRVSRDRYALIADTAKIAIWDYDLVSGEKYFSKLWYELFGFDASASKEELATWRERIDPKHLEHFDRGIKDHIEGKTNFFEGEYKIVSKYLVERYVHSTGKALFDDNGKAVRLAGSLIDITKIKHYEQELQKLAYYDNLSGLENRYSLSKESLALYGDGINFSLLYIDADNFKVYNDSLGHSIGDKLIKQIGLRLRRSLSGMGKVYRYGGDEFVILTMQVEKDELDFLCKKILKAFRAPITVSANSLTVSVSIGIANSLDAKDFDDLMRNADVAMYSAKARGKNTYEYFDEAMLRKITDRLVLERNLRSALDQEELSLEYQPQICLNTGKIYGFEALLRWNSKELGRVSPDRFISVAEESTLIIPIGLWVLRTACEFLRELNYIDPNLSMSVNISMLQLMQEDFVERVLDIIEDSRIDPSKLDLEITESVLMESYNTIKDRLLKLRSVGINISLDDFGKGYSSLTYLKELPISILKIDRNFVDKIESSEIDKRLIKNIINIGKDLDLKIIGEGIEQEGQLRFLMEEGCHYVQGYLLSHPLSPLGSIDALSHEIKLPKLLS